MFFLRIGRILRVWFYDLYLGACSGLMKLVNVGLGLEVILCEGYQGFRIRGVFV